MMGAIVTGAFLRVNINYNPFLRQERQFVEGRTFLLPDDPEAAFQIPLFTSLGGAE